MESLPDGAARALDRRIDALELLILRIIGTVALVSLVIGSFLPWITDEVDGEERTTGLNGTEASSTAVHWSAYVGWALGALMSMWVLVTDLGRRSVG